MRKLILYLHTSDFTQVSWAVIGETGTVQQTVMHGKFDDFASLAANKDIIVIVPSQDVLITQTKMPKLSRHRLLQALPFALEEQLLTDISDLHFAIGAYQADNMLPVALVSKQKMDTWLNTLKERGLSPIALIPDSLALPVIENTWQIVVQDDTVIARLGTYHGFACDKNNLNAFLDLKLAEEAQKPHTIQFRNYTADNIALIIGDTPIVEKKLPPKKFIEDLAKHVENPAINLLQGTYQPKRKIAHNKNVWLIAGYVFAAWLTLLFVGNLISFFILHHQTSQSQAAINKIYLRNFPQATSIVAPKERMSQKLDEVTLQGNKNRILLWLAYVGKSLSQTKNVKIEQLDYRNSQLTLSMTAATFANLDAFSRSLVHQGLTVKQQNVAAVGTKVKGDLLITAGGKS